MHFKKSRSKKRSEMVRQGTVEVKGVIQNVLSQRGWTEKLHEMQIIDAWGSIVGAHAAAQSVPVSLSGGVLRVEVAHPSYSTELSAMKTDILTKLEKAIESKNIGIQKPDKVRKVTNIRFHLNPHLSKVRSIEDVSISETEEDEPVFETISAEVNEQIEAAVSVVNDDELRDALKTLFLTQCSYKETTK